uniref:right-handed parallel beta-helix repeat-containing protein n=1 Tax=Polaribacter sp. TaxID=1920175 RepID=UPI004047A71A
MKKNLFLTILSLLFVISINAADIYVSDSGDDTTGDGSQGNPYKTLHQAVTLAVANDNIIIVGAVSQSVKTTIGKNLTITGTSNASITRTGTFNLIDVTLAATVSFSNITFQNMTNTGAGGVLYSAGSAANITFTNCTFSGNSTSGSNGGGVIFLGNLVTVNLTNCLLTGNNSTVGGGGAVSVSGTGTLNVNGSTFYNNSANTQGGAIRLQNTATATISKSTFFSNKITTNDNFSGAAVRANATGNTVTITNCLFYNNKGNAGAGDYTDYSGAAGGNFNATNTLSQTQTNFTLTGSYNDPSDYLATSSLTFNSPNVTFTAPTSKDDVTPIDFGTDNNDVGAWDSKINLFKGTSDSDWATGANWSSTAVPTSLENVTLLSDSPALVIGGSTNATINNLSVDAASSLTINSGGSLIVNGTSTGNVTYNRNLGTTNWYLVSSPFSGEDMTDMRANNSFATGTGSNIGFATYTTASNTWSYFANSATDALTAGLGYSAKLASAGDLSFTGTINTADVSVAVSNAGTGFNLIGNPFTSHVNSASLLGDNSANLVSQTLWVWNQATSSYDTYVTGDSFVLAPTQGFFVRSSNGTNINIAESYQASTGGTFQKSSKTEVKLMMNDGSNNRFVKMYYLDNATKGFDNGYDGETFGGIENSVDVFTNLVENNEGKKFQVQSLPIAEMETMIVPVGVKAAAGKEITFTADAMNLPGDTKVFLEDRLTNTITRLDEANSSYKVTLNDALNGTGRFYLHTKASGVLSTDEVVLQNTSIYAINNNTLRVVGLPSGNANVKMYNILGIQVMNTSFSSTGVKEISLPKLATGMYIIQLETAAGKLNKKIVLE